MVKQQSVTVGIFNESQNQIACVNVIAKPSTKKLTDDARTDELADPPVVDEDGNAVLGETTPVV